MKTILQQNGKLSSGDRQKTDSGESHHKYYDYVLNSSMSASDWGGGGYDLSLEIIIVIFSRGMGGSIQGLVAARLGLGGRNLCLLLPTTGGFGFSFSLDWSVERLSFDIAS